MQMRAGAVAGIARARQQATGLNALTFADTHRAFHQVQVDAHGAVIMQDTDEVTGRVVASSALGVLDLDHHAAPRRDDRRALGHGDIGRIAAFRGEVAVLAVGALGQAERAAAPGQRILVGLG